MFEQFNTLRTVFSQAKPLLLQYQDAEQINTFEQEMIQRINNQQPIVMVYGVYNAGKSTLINALTGEEVAEVGDIPKTDKVDSYLIGDVKILDTPGIDAPIEHEKISREQLEKSDAVIFVLSSDGVLEEQQTYDEIEKILTANKPMLVVINNKSGYTSADPEYISLVEKFRSNLRQHFHGDESLLNKLAQVQDYLVNAKTALKGKQENKPKLIEASQIRALEKAVTRLFYATGSAKIAKTLAVQLQKLLQQAIKAAGLQQNNSELQRLEQLITDISQRRAALLEKVMAHANRTKPALKSDLISYLENGQSQNTQQVLQQWQEQQSEYFSQQLERELKRLDTEAADVAQLFISTPGDTGYTEDRPQKAGAGLSSLFSALAGKGFKLGVTDELATQGIIAALKQGKDWFPALFKGIGPKTMQKMAGKAVPFIGPAIDAIMAIYDYWQAAKMEQRQIDQERQRRERITLQVNELAEQLYENLQESIEDALQDTFAPISSKLKKSLSEISNQSDGAGLHITSLEEAKLLLDKL